MTPATHDLDWDEIEDDLYVDDLPVLAVIGDPPREMPDGMDVDWPQLEDDGLLGKTRTYDGVEMVVYMPDVWRIAENGDVELTYNTGSGEFEMILPSEGYERVHVINPMNDELKDSVLMERSDLRLTAATS